MAYAYFPPRVSNYFPGGPPYLSGLGDYAADLATYKTKLAAWKMEHLKWQREKATYTALLAKYNLAVKNIEQEYSVNMAAYSAALDDYYTAFAGTKRGNTERSRTIDAAYGLKLPQSYYSGLACLTQAQHDSYAKNCTTVKGLGRWGLGSNDPDCGYAKLPICNYPVKPTAPTRVYPKTPTLRAEPKPPTAPTAPPPVVTTTPVTTTPSSSGGGGAAVPSPTPDVPPDAITPTADPNKQANMVRNGLLLVVVLGGGYLVYRTLKKPKAQAA